MSFPRAPRTAATCPSTSSTTRRSTSRPKRTQPECSSPSSTRSSLRPPTWTSAKTPAGAADDLLQVAHYQRLLESCGRASRLGRWGGILGREERVVWYDLDLPRWHPTEYIEDPPDRLLTTVELYDLEFAYRLSVIEASLLHLEDPDSPLLAEPIAVKECDGCGWQDWCFERMEASGDLSLLPGMTVAKRRKYLARGVMHVGRPGLLGFRHRPARCGRSRSGASRRDGTHRRPVDFRHRAAGRSTQAGGATGGRGHRHRCRCGPTRVR